MARSTRASARRWTLVPVLLVATVLCASAATRTVDPEELEGRVPTAEELEPSIAAAFGAESYRPGQTAVLSFFGHSGNVSLQLFRSGAEHTRTVGSDEMQGIAVGGVRPIGSVVPGRSVRIPIGVWPSGLYFARLRGSGLVGYAPFVVRPARLGVAPVAVVLPTMTWQAYNLRDDDGDGKGDSWYAEWSHLTVRLHRPFLDRGVPFNFRRYDLPFLHWLAWGNHDVDVLSDADVDGASGDRLARAYRLIVFPGHHEYVTTHEYDAIERYRDLGGHLMFLSANDFFWRVIKHGGVIEKTQQWRDLGRPESSLIGVQYRGNDRGTHRAPWVVRDVAAAPWLFAGTGLTDGASFGTAGIEIDKTAGASPRQVHVLADVRNLFGPGFTAQMTYYDTPRGAEVFAAGAFTIAGSALQPVVGRMLDNLWAHMTATGHE
jgi:hypothetical protein